MGCSEFRSTLGPEETAISYGEKQLNYDRNPATQYDLVFKSHMDENAQINQSRFVQCLKDLRLIPAHATDPQTFNATFYDHFKTDELYSVELLMILGILLSKSQVEEKAELLFDHLDIECTSIVQKYDFRQLLSKIFHVALVLNVPLGIGETWDQKLEDDRMQDYKELLLSVQKPAEESILFQIFGTAAQIEKPRFIQMFKTKDISPIVNSTGLRQYLLNTAKALKAQRAAMNQEAVARQTY